MEFVPTSSRQPKYDVDECQQRDHDLRSAAEGDAALIVFDIDEDTGAKSVKDIKEQTYYMGDMPLMTDNNGTFIVNGTERVIVSQMHRSPGVFFDHDKGKTTARASCSSPAASSPIAARGSISNSTPRTSCIRTYRPSPEAAGDVAALCAGS